MAELGAFYTGVSSKPAVTQPGLQPLEVVANIGWAAQGCSKFVFKYLELVCLPCFPCGRCRWKSWNVWGFQNLDYYLRLMEMLGGASEPKLQVAVFLPREDCPEVLWAKFEGVFWLKWRKVKGLQSSGAVVSILLYFPGKMWMLCVAIWADMVGTLRLQSPIPISWFSLLLVAPPAVVPQRD